MPVIDIQTRATAEDGLSAIATLAALIDSPQWPQVVFLIDSLLEKNGKGVFPRLLGPKDLAVILNCSTHQASKLLSSPGTHTTRIGRFPRMTREQLEKNLAKWST